MAQSQPPHTLEELLASLPEEERIILSLHYLKAMTNTQIAEMLGVPERAVTVVITSGKTRLLSALNRLL
jgi:RNA polymerase sigma factor (sigma-70 family)